MPDVDRMLGLSAQAMLSLLGLGKDTGVDECSFHGLELSFAVLELGISTHAARIEGTAKLTEIRYRMWPCRVCQPVHGVVLRNRTDKISDVAVLLKFRSRKLSHVLPGTSVGNVRGASNNLPPKSESALPLDELCSRQTASN